MMSGMFLELFAANMPNAMSLSGWTSRCAWATLLVGVAVTLYGARFAPGSRSIVGLGEIEARLQK